MTAGRMIYFFLPEQRVFKIKALSIGKYFVWLDIFSFLVQGVGGSMLSPGSSPSTMKLGLHVYMGGIGIQEFFILCFTLLIIGFHRRMLQLEKTAQVNRSPRWRLLSYALYAVLALITVSIRLPVAEPWFSVDNADPVIENRCVSSTASASFPEASTRKQTHYHSTKHTCSSSTPSRCGSPCSY